MIEETLTETKVLELDEKDKVILALQTELRNLRLQNIAEQELLKNNAKNLKATLALLVLDFTLTEEEFLEDVKRQIEALKNDETTAFLFEVEDTTFVGVEPLRNFDNKTDTNSLKELVKNYFSK